MKKVYLLLLFLGLFLSDFAQQKKWATNLGIELATDFMTGNAGMSTLKASDNPLVNTDMTRQFAAGAGFYVEFVHLHQRPNTGFGGTAPDFGLKTRLEWNYFYANNSKNGGGAATGLNYAVVPLLLEIPLGYHQGVTLPHYIPGTTTYHGVANSDNSVTVTENSTSGHYYHGGNPISGGTNFYFGPQVSYLIKSFNFSGDPIQDPNLKKSYVAFVGGFTLYSGNFNLDFSYEKGLTSIYNGKNIFVDGFLFRLGINFGGRLYN
ncbi:MAG: hypothetical protein ACYCOO_11350 [Chitinophagaceae bacterium]